jgi:HlyD family secretion protein
LFPGSIKEIRYSSIAEQNVVTYPVIVSAPNPELKLLPGMTATVSFDVDERLNVVRIPNSALRFYPDIEQVREEDRVVLEGASSKNQASQKSEEEPGSVSERWESRRNRNRRHVWIQEGDLLRAVAVETGVTDSRFSECLSGELKSGAKLVVRIKPAE